MGEKFVPLTGNRLAGVCGLLATLALSWQPASAGAAPAGPAPRIGHVFILLLENEGYDVTFGPASPAKYLNHLKRQGALVVNYFGISHFSLGNYIALISGQAPNPATNNDCEQFTDFAATGLTSDGQAIGSG